MIENDGGSTASAWDAEAAHATSVRDAVEVMYAHIVDDTLFCCAAAARVAREVVLDSVLVNAGKSSLLGPFALQTRADTAPPGSTRTYSDRTDAASSTGLCKFKFTVQLGTLMWSHEFGGSMFLIVAIDWHDL